MTESLLTNNQLENHDMVSSITGRGHGLKLNPIAEKTSSEEEEIYYDSSSHVSSPASSDSRDFECLVCFHSFCEKGQEVELDVCICPNCTATYHSDCIKQWRAAKMEKLRESVRSGEASETLLREDYINNECPKCHFNMSIPDREPSGVEIESIRIEQSEESSLSSSQETNVLNVDSSCDHIKSGCYSLVITCSFIIFIIALFLTYFDK